MTIVQELVPLKLERLVTEALIHSSMMRIFVKMKFHASVMELKNAKSFVSCSGGICNHIFVAKTCAPSWIKMTLVVVLQNLVKNKLSDLIVVSITTWEEHAIEVLEFFKCGRLRFTIYDWYDSSTTGLHESDVVARDIRRVIREPRISHQISVQSLGDDSDDRFLI